MNPWVLSRNEDVYGEDTEKFVPERWLQGKGEGKTEFEERTKRMQACDLSFGSGNRACLGRPLALIELYKVIVTIFGKYKVCGFPPRIFV
jgi:cytochrome P450